ncbi:MAG: CsgG/HfaB family protein, partial [Verrucomicrobiota bacterium]
MKARDKKKFRKLAVSGVCAAVLLVCNTPAATITNSSLPVAVLDFSVPTNDAHWSWARNGIADLLQIELQQAGVLTLDRDFVQLVLREQKLLSEPGTTQDQFKLASLLHAGHLITGRVMSLEGGRFRVEATAFSVEAIEVVATGVGEGAYPLELSAVLQSVSRTLAKKLTALGVVANEIRASGYTPKPESLILFYRGLNAFTRGQPEVAVACFMNSAELDPDFAAPLLWEIKAYEVSGFQPHAAIRREEIVPLLKKIGVQFELPSGENRDAKPVLAVLNVSAESSNREDGVRLSTSVSATLKASLLSSGKVQVFAFENIGAAMTEQDLKLSDLFSRQAAPRYGRWLMADALLQCRVRKIDPDRVTVELSLVDPLRTLELARIEQTGKLIELNAVVAASVERLLAVWKKEKIAATVGSASTTNLPGDLAEEEMREMRPPFKRLVRALVAVRRAPKDGERRGELANGFVATGRLRQAGEEINRRLDTLDIHAPKTDLTYYGIYRWVVFDVGVARPWADTEKVTRLIDELLTNHPHSLAAGCLLYNLAINEWRAGNSEEVIQRAVGSRNVLKGTSPPNSKGGINARNAFIGAT